MEHLLAPAWVVALATAGYLGARAVIMVKGGTNGNGKGDVARERAVGELKTHVTEARDTVMTNVDETRHALATPLTTLNLNLALMQQTLTEIRDRLPPRRGER